MVDRERHTRVLSPAVKPPPPSSAVQSRVVRPTETPSALPKPRAASSAAADAAAAASSSSAAAALLPGAGSNSSTMPAAGMRTPRPCSYSRWHDPAYEPVLSSAHGTRAVEQWRAFEAKGADRDLPAGRGSTAHRDSAPPPQATTRPAGKPRYAQPAAATPRKAPWTPPSRLLVVENSQMESLELRRLLVGLQLGDVGELAPLEVIPSAAMPASSVSVSLYGNVSAAETLAKLAHAGLEAKLVSPAQLSRMRNGDRRSLPRMPHQDAASPEASADLEHAQAWELSLRARRRASRSASPRSAPLMLPSHSSSRRSSSSQRSSLAAQAQKQPEFNDKYFSRLPAPRGLSLMEPMTPVGGAGRRSTGRPTPSATASTVAMGGQTPQQHQVPTSTAPTANARPPKTPGRRVFDI